MNFEVLWCCFDQYYCVRNIFVNREKVVVSCLQLLENLSWCFKQVWKSCGYLFVSTEYKINPRPLKQHGCLKHLLKSIQFFCMILNLAYANSFFKLMWFNRQIAKIKFYPTFKVPFRIFLIMGFVRYQISKHSPYTTQKNFWWKYPNFPL